MTYTHKRFLSLILCTLSSTLSAFDGWLYFGDYPYVFEQQTNSWHYVHEGDLDSELTDETGLIKKVGAPQQDSTLRQSPAGNGEAFGHGFGPMTTNAGTSSR
jgi:hypothetical protein